jgi:hypothetical protein
LASIAEPDEGPEDAVVLPHAASPTTTAAATASRPMTIDGSRESRVQVLGQPEREVVTDPIPHVGSHRPHNRGLLLPREAVA